LKIPRWLDRCIICLTEPPFPNRSDFSEEHIIPRALGGQLTCEFLCKSCNETFGNTFESKARTDPSVRLAIHNLSAQLPELYASIENGQRYLVETDVGTFTAYYRNGLVQSSGTKLDDGSLIVPDDTAEKHLRNIMKKEGLNEPDIKKALAKWQGSHFEEEIALTTKTKVAKRQTKKGTPDLDSGKPLNPLVALKIAYEYSVLLLGGAALDDQVQFNEIRRCLQCQDSNSGSFRVERFHADKHDPFHGIAFEGNRPHATIQIRLFGLLAYRVHLFGLGFNIERTYYTHNLDV
jgi:hypothetical protein